MMRPKFSDSKGDVSINITLINWVKVEHDLFLMAKTESNNCFIYLKDEKENVEYLSFSFISTLRCLNNLSLLLSLNFLMRLNLNLQKRPKATSSFLVVFPITTVWRHNIEYDFLYSTLWRQSVEYYIKTPYLVSYWVDMTISQLANQKPRVFWINNN